MTGGKVSLRRLRGFAGVLGLIAGLAGPRLAHAQDASAEAAATALFDEGRKLMTAHDYAAACPKLAESERLAPSGGTLLNLAECYEHVGQTASAWVAWKDAAARANAAGKADAEKRALARAAALEPGLAKLTITVADGSDVPGLQVQRDGVTVGHAEFGIAIPVDPGRHTVEAKAPGKLDVTTKIEVAAKQANASVVVTLLSAPTPPPAVVPITPSPSPGAAPPVTPPPGAVAPAEPASSWSTQKTLALVSGGVGVVGVALGSVFGLQAKSKNDQALEPQNCRTSTTCTPAGLALTSDAKNAATLSNVFFAVGGVGLAGGVVLWVLAPSSPSKTGLRVTPTVGAAYSGLSLDGAF